MNYSNYYVLAWLTPKGGKQTDVQAWTILSVNKDQLNRDGTWLDIIPDQDVFNVCYSDWRSTGNTTAYDSNLYDIYARLYGTGNPVNDAVSLRNSNGDQAPNGYEFIDPLKDTYNGIGRTVVQLRGTFTKKQRVKIKLDQPGIIIPTGGNYKVRISVYHNNGEPTSRAYIDLPAITENDIEAETSDLASTIWWRLGISGQFPNDVTGNEANFEVELVEAIDHNGATLDAGRLNTESVIYPVYSVGTSFSGYTVAQGTKEYVDDIDNHTRTIYYVLNLVKNVNGINKGTIDSYLYPATNFGLYTEELAQHSTDMESNIGAAVVTGQIGADYGFTNNNTRVNRLDVKKLYIGEDGKAAKNKPVTLRLYSVEYYDDEDNSYILGEEIATKTQDTGNDGTVDFTFDKLPAGRYVLKEVIGGIEYSYRSGEDGKTTISSSGQTIKFEDDTILIKNINVNENYFGSVADGVDLFPLLRHSRYGWIRVDEDETYNKLLELNGGKENGKWALVEKTHGEYNIPADMVKL